MKKIYTIIAGILLTASVFAQAPEKMNYQAVVRNASNSLVTSTGVGMQISILQGSATGAAVYAETQTPTTNANGLVSLEIGTGTVVSGDFTTIDWANGTYFIKTETDPTTAGGTNYTITGTTQLMSVSYALHAKTAESITGTINYTEIDPVFGASIANGVTATDTANWNNHTIDTDTQLTESQVDAFVANNGYLTTEIDGSVTNEIQTISRIGTTVTLSNGGGTFTDSVNIYTAGTGVDITNNVISTTSGSTHYVGELFGGGIVFYVYNNGANGLIASLDDLDGGSGVSWSGITNATAGVYSRTDGIANTAGMIAQSTTANKAGTLCNSYAGGGFTDWYLPSNRELVLLASEHILIDKILYNDSDPTTNGFDQGFTPRYWSSTERTQWSAWFFDFETNGVSDDTKTTNYNVRAIRTF